MNTRMNKTVTTLFASAILALAGCKAAPAQTAPKAPVVTEVHVKLSEFKIELDKTTIPAGPVKFLITNTGNITHELVLEPADAVDKAMQMDGKSAEAEKMGAGKPGTLEWTLDKPGKYRLACHVTDNNIDHFKQGMVAEITVTAP